MRVRQLSSKLVFERYAPDARALVATGAFAFAGEREPTIAERLRALPRATIAALCVQASIPLPAATLHNPRPEVVAIERLVPLIERGLVHFPAAATAGSDA